MWKQNPLYMDINEVEAIEDTFADLVPEEEDTAPQVDDEPEQPVQFVPFYDSIKDNDDISGFEETKNYDDTENDDDTEYLLNARP